jgi:hypothetical protein
MAITKPKAAEYLTRDEAAEFIGKSAPTLDRWRKDAKTKNRPSVGPPATVIGRTILYRKDSLEAWLKAQQESFW